MACGLIDWATNTPRTPRSVADDTHDHVIVTSDDVMTRTLIRRLGHHHGRIVHGPVLAQGFDGIDDRRAFLPDQDIDAVHVFATLVDDGIDGDRTPSEPLVTDYQLALTFADRNQGVDDL